MINEIQHIIDVLDPIVITPAVTIIVSWLKAKNVDPHRALFVVSVLTASIFVLGQHLHWWEYILPWIKTAAYIGGVAILIYETIGKRYFKPKA